MKLREKLMHKYALSEKGASDMIKAFVSVTISDLVLMVPISMLYFLVEDYMNGTLAGKGMFYLAGCLISMVLIAVTTYIQYNATFLSTYVESGVRRITLAEKLRKIPLSFFGKKDLSDLTSTIMADCAIMETASSHFIPELVGACISTTLVAIGLFFFDWRMAIAALWVLPVSFAIVICSEKVQDKLNKKQMDYKMACADGIQEGLESVRDLQAYNYQDDYMNGLDTKIHAVEKHAIVTELGMALFVGSAQMILKLGIATVALTGGYLLASGKIDIITFFMFLMVVSRIYDPMQVSLQNVAAINAAGVQSDRLDEIVDLMLETVCTARKRVRIAGDDYPAELVKSKFMKLDGEHIRFVLDCMRENTTKIRNIKQYLKAALFNAPSTIGNYYTSLVAHDMASGALSPKKPQYGDPDYYSYNEGESL